MSALPWLRGVGSRDAEGGLVAADSGALPATSGSDLVKDVIKITPLKGQQAVPMPSVDRSVASHSMQSVDCDGPRATLRPSQGLSTVSGAIEIELAKLFFDVARVRQLLYRGPVLPHWGVKNADRLRRRQRWASVGGLSYVEFHLLLYARSGDRTWCLVSPGAVDHVVSRGLAERGGRDEDARPESGVKHLVCLLCFEREDSLEPRQVLCVTKGLMTSTVNEVGPCVYFGNHAVEQEFQCADAAELDAMTRLLGGWGAVFKPLNSLYTINSLVGRGSFAKVYSAVHTYTGQKVVLKIIEKKLVKASNVYSEIEVLRNVKHPCVIGLHAAHEDEDYVCLVLDALEGGEVFDWLRQHGRLSDAHARVALQRLVLALYAIHKQGFVHRDLKTENLMFKQEGNPESLTLIDFGLSGRLGSPNMKMRCGSPGYVAPEVLESQNYDTRVDVFAAGVILYTLLCGFAPFRGKTPHEILRRNLECKIEFPDRCAHVPPAARDLIRRMTHREPDRRLELKHILNHPYFLPVPKRLLIDPVSQILLYLKEYEERVKKDSAENYPINPEAAQTTMLPVKHAMDPNSQTLAPPQPTAYTPAQGVQPATPQNTTHEWNQHAQLRQKPAPEIMRKVPTPIPQSQTEARREPADALDTLCSEQSVDPVAEAAARAAAEWRKHSDAGDAEESLVAFSTQNSLNAALRGRRGSACASQSSVARARRGSLRTPARLVSPAQCKPRRGSVAAPRRSAYRQDDTGTWQRAQTPAQPPRPPKQTPPTAEIIAQARRNLRRVADTAYTGYPESGYQAHQANMQQHAFQQPAGHQPPTYEPRVRANRRASVHAGQQTPRAPARRARQPQPSPELQRSALCVVSGDNAFEVQSPAQMVTRQMARLQASRLAQARAQLQAKTKIA